ncbi:MAG: HAD-IC family P-type ATPase [Clostridia bacterium]|nr:HAD-IC family P-type ATPase [Clostridia bacterium]
MALKKKKQNTDEIKEEKESLDSTLNAEVSIENTVANKKEKSKKQKALKAENIREKNEKKQNKKGKNNTEEIKPIKIKRIKADFKNGLSSEQVADRNEKGLNNVTPNTNVKTYKSIFVENIFTFFNMLCFAIFISLAIVGAWKSCIFMVIILANIAIGIIQEIRAKRTIEKLSLLTAPVVNVMRDGVQTTISTDEVVLDDIIVLSTGKQIVADCTIIEGQIEVNESLLTGESLPIKKKAGDTILGGSFVVSGSCYARAEKVGVNTYIHQLSSKAKKYKRPKSELFSSLRLIIKVIGIILIPIAILMYINNYVTSAGATTTDKVVDTITKTAGSIIGMIPSGMFLLCSVALTVSVIKLAHRKALVQDLYCVEMLARVNVLCLDKTGTITDGTMKVYNCIQLENTDITLKRAMGSMLSSLPDNNQTSQALVNYFGYNKELKPTTILPFSSSRKLSAVTFEGHGTYIMGAQEFVMPELKDKKTLDMIEQYSKDGYRVLLLAHSDGKIVKENLPASKTAVAILILEDRIRDEAVSTIKWFKQNGVKVKIISGDNPLTVAEIAKRVGVDNTEKFINLEGMNEKQIIAAANKYTVFGRVTPEQKAILVKAIKSAGNTVAMTGDGVNDILALKEADCAVAMASGSEAVRSVSHMVLLNSDFGSMPETVKEGRRVINNVQKSSSLFFMKTIFSIFFSIFILIIHTVYPLSTENNLLLETFVIGIPSFFLAFLPNDKPIEGKFIYNLFKNALPGALTLILNGIAVYTFVWITKGSLDYASTLTTMMTIVVTFTGLALLLRLCKPFNALTGTLMVTMTACCFVLMLIIPTFFKLVSISLTDMLFVIILILLAPTLIDIFYKVLNKIKIK